MGSKHIICLDFYFFTCMSLNLQLNLIRLSLILCTDISFNYIIYSDYCLLLSSNSSKYFMDSVWNDKAIKSLVLIIVKLFVLKKHF